MNIIVSTSNIWSVYQIRASMNLPDQMFPVKLAPSDCKRTRVHAPMPAGSDSPDPLPSESCVG